MFASCLAQFRVIQVTPSGTVHMLWLVPQYFFLTTAEILFAASGMQFSFLEVL